MRNISYEDEGVSLDLILPEEVDTETEIYLKKCILEIFGDYYSIRHNKDILLRYNALKNAVVETKIDILQQFKY